MDVHSEENKNSNSEDKSLVGNGFIEFLTVVVRYRWFLFWFVFIITAGATIYALVAPKWYKSTVSVLPAEKTDFLSALSGLSSLVKNFSPTKGLAALTGNNDFDQYIAILKSSTMIDDVIKKFDLQKEYDFGDDYYYKVEEEFNSNLEIEIQDEGNLTLSVYDKNPQRAANIANYMVDKLNSINTKLSSTNARANREFIEKRYLDNIKDINRLETNMKDFQQKYGVVAVPEQLESTVKAMSEIYADLARKEVAANIIRRTYGTDSPILTRAEMEVQELQKKINQLNSGKDNTQDGINLLIPFKKAPELANKYLKITRDLEIQYKILEFVQPLYEQAKVEEVRNSPSVLVLDKAGPAERKSKPRGTLYALLSFIISFGVGLFIIFTKEISDKFKVSNSEKYNFISKSFRRDWLKLTFRNRD